MAETLNVNASPIICLAKAGLADLILHTATRVLIPKAVLAEISAGPADDPGRQWVERNSTLIEVDVPVIEPDILRWQLGSGESAVIQLAINRIVDRPLAALDDYRARSAATHSGIQCRGSIGIIPEAKRRKLIPSVRPSLQLLVDAGLRVHPALIRSALEATEES